METVLFRGVVATHVELSNQARVLTDKNGYANHENDLRVCK